MSLSSPNDTTNSTAPPPPAISPITHPEELPSLTAHPDSGEIISSAHSIAAQTSLPVMNSQLENSQSIADDVPPSKPHRRRSSKRTSRPSVGFSIAEKIGKGSFAVVYKGQWSDSSVPTDGQNQDTNNRQTVAVKVIQLAHLKKEKRLMGVFEAEMAILKKMTHPHVVHLFDVIKTPTDYNLIMEYCSIGDLSHFIRNKQHLIRNNPEVAKLYQQYPSNYTGLHPHLVRHFLAQLASSLSFLRAQDIVHRDLKPQNLLLKPAVSSVEEARELGYAGSWNLPVIKIADFGFARFLPATSMAETLCGSPLYMAPEILNYEKYNAKADLWSVGAITYEMSIGKSPFPAANHLELIRKIDNGKDVIDFPFDIESDLQAIIRGLLRRKPENRLTFEDFFQRTAWFHQGFPKSKSSGGLSKHATKITSAKSISALVTDSSSMLNTPRSNRDKLASSPTSANLSRNNSTISHADGSSLGSSSSENFASYSQFLRRQGDNFAVASPSPSPESSHIHIAPSPNDHGSMLATRPSASADERRSSRESYNSRAQRKVNRGEGRSGDSENDYVFIEKQLVEVNALADDLQSPSTMSNRRAANPPEKPMRRRRLSSIAYGASPTNALAQALLKSSARLFGVKGDTPSAVNVSSGSASSGDDRRATITGHVATTTLQKGEKQMIDELEQLATMGKVVSLYAEVKYVQLDLDLDDRNDLDHDSLPFGATMSDDSTDSLRPTTSANIRIDPFHQMRLAQEALVLHLKALSILARAMSRASEWWDQHQRENSNMPLTPGVNALVQWIRDKFNQCVARAESERNLVKQLVHETGSKPPEVSAERLLFDRALEMSKTAAVQEMSAVESSGSFGENSTTCEMNYGTAVWMLRSLLVPETPQEELSEDDRTMVETLMSKIAQRLVSLRRKIAPSSQNSSASLLDRRRASGSPGSQKSMHLSRGTSYVTQMTPP